MARQIVIRAAMGEFDPASDRRADVSSQTAGKRTRDFSMVAYTGGALEVEGWELPLYVDLDVLEIRSQKRPILYAHKSNLRCVAGQSRVIRVADYTLLIDGIVFAQRPVGREICELADDGFVWQASIGVNVPADAIVEEVREGATAQVNGRTVEGPCSIARAGCVLGETSFVVEGADDRTSARIAARKARAARGVKGLSAMPTFEDFCRALGLDPAAMTADQQTAARSAYDAQYGTTALAEGEEDDVLAEGDDEEIMAEGAPAFEEWLAEEGVDPVDLSEEDLATYRQMYDEAFPAAVSAKAKAKAKARAKAKAGAGAGAGRPTPGRKITAYARSRAKEIRRVAAIEAACKGHPKILAKALDEGWSVDKAKLHVIRASRSAAPLPARGQNVRTDAKLIEAALLMSANIKAERIAKWYGEKITDQATAREMRGVSLHYAMDRVIEAAGENFRGVRKSNSFCKAALAAERKIRASGGFTTLSLSSILENVANKALLDSYETVETVWQMVCGVRNHSDFKVASRYRLDSKGAFRPVGPAGELKHIGLENAKYENQVDTFGAIISLTRKMQIDDDLQAFLELPRIFGRLGKLAPEEEFFKLLLANAGDFFGTGNRNLLSGADSVLAIAGLTGMETLFNNQVDSNNKPILTSPSVLLVGSALITTANQLYTDTTVVATTTANKPITSGNPYQGRYKPVMSPYANNTNIKDRDGNAITGQDAKKWWMFADPNVRAAFGMAFLNGVQTPTIESDDAVFDTLGIQMRAYMDFGVGVEDPSGAAQSNGQ